MIAANTTRLLFAWQEADQKEHEEEKDRDDNDIRSHVDKGVIGLIPCFNEVVPLLEEIVLLRSKRNEPTIDIFVLKEIKLGDLYQLVQDSECVVWNEDTDKWQMHEEGQPVDESPKL